MALNADQIAANAAAAIQATGLMPSKQSFLDNPFAESINPSSKTRLALLNTAVAAVPTEKRISLETKKLQKLLDLLEDMNTRLLNLDAIKRHANRYCCNDATTDDVPALNAMNIAGITLNTDNDHKKLLFNRKDQFIWTKSDGTEVSDGPTLIRII
eukprot:12911929-Ditylum_brightwellii.AAC.1